MLLLHALAKEVAAADAACTWCRVWEEVAEPEALAAFTSSAA